MSMTTSGRSSADMNDTTGVGPMLDLREIEKSYITRR
jgi:hypothetical protein